MNKKDRDKGLASWADYLLGVPLELLTNELVDELAKDGWEKDRLLRYQQEGRSYNRNRDVIVLVTPKENKSLSK